MLHFVCSHLDSPSLSRSLSSPLEIVIYHLSEIIFTRLIQLGRSKWNGNVGNYGIVVRAETPLGNFGRPSVTVQLNGGT